MWQVEIRTIETGRIQRYVISKDDVPLSFEDVISLWRDNPRFRNYFSGLLADSPFVAYRWETPKVTATTKSRDFEFVLLRCDALNRPVNISAFAQHFDSNMDVVTFSNLGGDAVLVVPCKAGDASIYGHLASVIRHAPETQLHQLWRSVASAMEQRISDCPVWLSTAGMGVSWLHIRLDDRPKYYGYSPFRQHA